MPPFLQGADKHGSRKEREKNLKQSFLSTPMHVRKQSRYCLTDEFTVSSGKASYASTGISSSCRIPCAGGAIIARLRVARICKEYSMWDDPTTYIYSAKRRRFYQLNTFQFTVVATISALTGTGVGPSGWGTIANTTILARGREARVYNQTTQTLKTRTVFAV